MKSRDFDVSAAYQLGRDEAHQDFIVDLAEYEAVDADGVQSTELRDAYKQGRESVRGSELTFQDLEYGARFHFLGSWPGAPRSPGWRMYTKLDSQRYSRSENGHITVHRVQTETAPVSRAVPGDLPEPEPTPEPAAAPAPAKRSFFRSRA